MVESEAHKALRSTTLLRRHLSLKRSEPRLNLPCDHFGRYSTRLSGAENVAKLAWLVWRKV